MRAFERARMSAAPKAFICGCAGLALTREERVFISQHRPWGLILFKRNIKNNQQITEITSNFRMLAARFDAPVLIDQEGGRVQRMGPPQWPNYPSAATFARLGAEAAEHAALATRLMANDLRAVGITVDCLPVLDTPQPGGHRIIGDRAYGETPEQIAHLGRAAAAALLASGVLPVMKHIPGHGRALADSHLELPVVTASRADLEAVDFKPFQALADLPMAMTAHVVYTAIDAERPATTSPKVIAEVVRGAIGFDGLLMSDDLSMNALSGDLRARATAAFRAGVDIALHCNGDLAEAEAVAQAAPFLSGRAAERASRALGLLAAEPTPFDPVDARARLDLALASLA